MAGVLPSRLALRRVSDAPIQPDTPPPPLYSLPFTRFPSIPLSTRAKRLQVTDATIGFLGACGAQSLSGSPSQAVAAQMVRGWLQGVGPREPRLDGHRAVEEAAIDPLASAEGEYVVNAALAS